MDQLKISLPPVRPSIASKPRLVVGPPIISNTRSSSSRALIHGRRKWRKARGETRREQFEIDFRTGQQSRKKRRKIRDIGREKTSNELIKIAKREEKRRGRGRCESYLFRQSYRRCRPLPRFHGQNVDVARSIKDAIVWERRKETRLKESDAWELGRARTVSSRVPGSLSIEFLLSFRGSRWINDTMMGGIEFSPRNWRQNNLNARVRFLQRFFERKFFYRISI